MDQFLSLSEYNTLIGRKGSEVFVALPGLELIPSRNLPVKVFLHGAGTYAAVFKGSYLGKTIAIRCFLNERENIEYRYKEISAHLQSIDADWKCQLSFHERGLKYGDVHLPVITMDWATGQPLNDFISNNLTNHTVLNALQEKIVEVSTNLEENHIGHGDIQASNVLVNSVGESIQLKLIDYDGMFVPSLENLESIELGRSEYQHPNRDRYYFSAKVDRFAFWVILTAIEALKFKPELWKEVMKGGFNTLDNLLFTYEDFKNPAVSSLMNRLRGMNQDSINYYLNKIYVSLAESNLDNISPLRLFNEHHDAGFDWRNNPSSNKTNKAVQLLREDAAKQFHHKDLQLTKDEDYFRITSQPNEVTVENASGEKVGITPLELLKADYVDQTVYVLFGQHKEELKLISEKSIYELNFKPPKDTRVISKVGSGKSAPPITQTHNTADENHLRHVQDEEKIRLEESKRALEKKLHETKEENKQLKTSQASKKSRFRWYYSLYILVFVVLIVAFALRNQKLSINGFKFHQEELVIENPEEQEVQQIKNLLYTEDTRNLDSIMSYYSAEVDRYWHIDNPSKEQLKEAYRKAWRLTSYSKNEIVSIDKIEGNTYLVNLRFTFLHNRENKMKTVLTSVNIVLDSNGKISSVYGSEKEMVYSIDRVDDRMTIDTSTFFDQFFMAEYRGDVDPMLEYFSDPCYKYYSIYNPKRSQIRAAYHKSWDISENSRNDVLRIIPEGNNRYQVDVRFTFYDVRKKAEREFLSSLLFEFDDFGKILRLYSKKSEEVLAKAENSPSEVKSQILNDVETGREKPVNSKSYSATSSIEITKERRALYSQLLSEGYALGLKDYSESRLISTLQVWVLGDPATGEPVLSDEEVGNVKSLVYKKRSKTIYLKIKGGSNRELDWTYYLE